MIRDREKSSAPKVTMTIAARFLSGRRDDGLTTEEHRELTVLRRENKRLKLEAEILSKAAAWFARETNAVPNKSSDS